MKRKSKTVQIFSLSAIDLLASALGSFVVLAVILYPYYLKTQRTVADAGKFGRGNPGS